MIADRYNVRLTRDGEMIDATVRYYKDRNWEIAHVSVDIDGPIEPPVEPSPHHYLVHLVQTLEQKTLCLHTCGTCTHFRRSPGQQGSGWMGYCSYRGPDEGAPPIPGEVSLLAPSCPAFDYAGTDQLQADPADITHHGYRIDPEQTRDLPASGEEEVGLLERLCTALGLKRQEPERPVRADPIERPGDQPCPVCGRNLTHRASLAHADRNDAERVLSVWRCSNCGGNFLDDWSEAHVGSASQEADRLFVVPPIEANRGVDLIIRNYRWDWKACTTVASRYYHDWVHQQEHHGRRIFQWEARLEVEE